MSTPWTSEAYEATLQRDIQAYKDSYAERLAWRMQQRQRSRDLGHEREWDMAIGGWVKVPAKDALPEGSGE